MLAPGTHLGSYRVESLIGQGGMGEVYRATDTRLDRVVAVKILPPHLSARPDLRERFEREARAVSSLTHPNICTLYDVGRHDGVDFLVMELVEGESLADRLARGALPLDQVVRYGSEIADALASAHKRGIVHRDLKPGNVMITKAGAKLLDFGLAKSAAGGVSTPDAPTEAHKPLTAEGTILGTIQYMAPEQLEGRDADVRADIFALGAVLYEMVTGRRAFGGNSRASVIAAILDRDPPPISTAEPATSPALDRIIRACLAKDPDARLQSASDVAMQLRWLRDATDEVARPAMRRRLWPVAAVVLLLALIAAGIWMATRARETSRPSFHLSLLPPGGYSISNASMSRQGALAFVAGNGASYRLFVRPLDQPHSRELLAIKNRGYPFWSPDGEWIAFFDVPKLKRIRVSGGTPQEITDSSYGFGGAWLDDGTIVFTPGFAEPLHVVPASGGKARPLMRLDAKRNESVQAWPVALPDGRGILYVSVSLPGVPSIIRHVGMDGRAPKDILTAEGLVGYSAPFLLFVRGADIYAIRFDAHRLETEGEPVRVVEQVAYNADASSAFAAVVGDTIAFPPRIPQKRRLVWYARTGAIASVALEDDDVFGPRLSSDGKRLLLTKSIPQNGGRGVYQVDLERGTRSFLTPLSRSAFGGVWLPDGERFVFSSAIRSADYDLYIQPGDAQAAPVPLWEGRSDDKEVVMVSRDGTFLIAREYLPASMYDLWLVPLPGGPRKPLVTGAGADWGADVAGDGKWLIYTSSVSGRFEVSLRPFEGGRSIQISTAGGWNARWSRDGSEIFFMTADRAMMAATFRAGPGGPEVSVPKLLFRAGPDAEHDFELNREGTMFLVNELADTGSAIQPYSIISGWKQALEKR
jgi:serine/threonine protein kinase/Tol biopolymer transport system component